MKKFQAYLILVLLFIPITAFAYELTRQSAEDFIAQLNAVINTRNASQIEKFFKYYSTNDARFVKHTIVVDPNDPSKITEADTNKNLDEYIDSLKKNLIGVIDYGFVAYVQKFDLQPGGKSAIVQIHIDEVSISSIPGETPNIRVQAKTVVSSNCNLNLKLAASSPIISGITCAEKIIIQ